MYTEPLIYLVTEIPTLFPTFMLWLMPAMIVLLGIACDLFSWQPNQFVQTNPFEDQVVAIWGDNHFITPDVDCIEDTIILGQDEMVLVIVHQLPATRREKWVAEMNVEFGEQSWCDPHPSNPGYYRWLVGQRKMHDLMDREEEAEVWDEEADVTRLLYS